MPRISATSPTFKKCSDNMIPPSWFDDWYLSWKWGQVSKKCSCSIRLPFLSCYIFSPPKHIFFKTPVFHRFLSDQDPCFCTGIVSVFSFRTVIHPRYFRSITVHISRYLQGNVWTLSQWFDLIIVRAVFIFENQSGYSNLFALTERGQGSDHWFLLSLYL